MSDSQHQSIQKNNNVLVKRKKTTGPEEVRISYKLQFADSALNFRDITEEEFENFKEQFPKLAEVILNPELLTTNPSIQSKINQENWQAAATQLITAVWKIKNAMIFHAPVDPVKLNIPDYFNVIKKPMDFGTIKVKLIRKSLRLTFIIRSRIFLQMLIKFF